MRKLIALTALSLLIAPVAAAAPVDPTPNGVGIYFDTEGISNCAYAEPYTNLTAYVLLTNPTSASIIGWEAALLINPTSFPAGITFDIGPDALNVFTVPNFNVGYLQPHSGNPITLLTITTFYLGGPVVLGLGSANPCFPGPDPCLDYVDGVDQSLLVQFVPSVTLPWTLPAYGFGGPAPSYFCYAMAGVNAMGAPGSPCAEVAVEEASWGGVKALYGE